MTTIHILMATHNGARFLDDQLTSLLAQTHEDWQLWVSDDLSRDATREQLRAFGRAHPDRLANVRDGPGQGSAANFLSLLADPAFKGAWVAFCDQDDVWMPDKLARAVTQISAAPEPACYASRTVLTDAELGSQRASPRHPRPLGFGNALVQNVLAGNTIVLPPEGTDLVRSTIEAALAADVPFHDWWIYQVVTGAGMAIIHDDVPSLYYRQHDRNLLGDTVARRGDRLRGLVQGEYADWISRNMTALRQLQGTLTPDAAQTVRDVLAWRKASALRRSAPQALGLYRQTRAGNVALRMLARAGLM